MTYTLAKWLCRPYTLLLLAMVWATVTLWWRGKVPRKRLLWLTIPLLVLIVISLPATACCNWA